jgi:hypothetical protein
MGEGSATEYIASFPTNAHELGKEIAAFATSGGGTILLGVTDEGNLQGLADVDTPDRRDALLRRLEGVCHGMVKPSITPTTSFAVEEGRVILVIEVPEGSEAIYYCSRIPYLRHLTQSRPAEPHEVVQIVRRWLSRQSDTDPLAYAIASAWSNVSLYADDLDDWYVEPHFSGMRAQLGAASDSLRTAAATDRAVLLGVDADLKKAAQALDQATSWQPVMGEAAWSEFKSHVKTTRTLLQPLYTRNVLETTPTASAVGAAQSRIRQHARQATDLAERLPKAIDEGGLDDLLRSLSLEGFYIFHEVSQLGAIADEDVRRKIQRAAVDLHKLPTVRFHPADPKTHPPLLDGARQHAAAITELIGMLAPGGSSRA